MSDPPQDHHPPASDGGASNGNGGGSGVSADPPPDPETPAGDRDDDSNMVFDDADAVVAATDGDLDPSADGSGDDGDGGRAIGRGMLSRMKKGWTRLRSRRGSGGGEGSSGAGEGSSGAGEGSSGAGEGTGGEAADEAIAEAAAAALVSPADLYDIPADELVELAQRVATAFAINERTAIQIEDAEAAALQRDLGPNPDTVAMMMRGSEGPSATDPAYEQMLLNTGVLTGDEDPDLRRALIASAWEAQQVAEAALAAENAARATQEAQTAEEVALSTATEAAIALSLEDGGSGGEAPAASVDGADGADGGGGGGDGGNERLWSSPESAAAIEAAKVEAEWAADEAAALASLAGDDGVVDDDEPVVLRKAFEKMRLAIVNKQTTLRLSRSSLTIVPPDVGDVVWLEKLLLFKNQISHIPEDITRLVHLHRLSLYTNCLTDEGVAPVWKLTSVSFLSLSDNYIETLPAAVTQMVSLEKLFLYGNEIAAIPPQISRLTNLVKLQFGGKLAQNRLKFRKLDKSQKHRGNRLTAIPYTLAYLPRLEFLGLEFNPIEKPPPARYQNREQVLAALAPFVDEIRWAAYFSVMCELTLSSIRVIGAPHEPDPLLDRY